MSLFRSPRHARWCSLAVSTVRGRRAVADAAPSAACGLHAGARGRVAVPGRPLLQVQARFGALCLGLAGVTVKVRGARAADAAVMLPCVAQHQGGVPPSELRRLPSSARRSSLRCHACGVSRCPRPRRHRALVPLAEALAELLAGSGGGVQLAGQAPAIRSWLDGLADVSQVRQLRVSRPNTQR